MPPRRPGPAQASACTDHGRCGILPLRWHAALRGARRQYLQIHVIREPQTHLPWRDECSRVTAQSNRVAVYVRERLDVVPIARRPGPRVLVEQIVDIEGECPVTTLNSGRSRVQRV